MPLWRGMIGSVMSLLCIVLFCFFARPVKSSISTVSQFYDYEGISLYIGELLWQNYWCQFSDPSNLDGRSSNTPSSLLLQLLSYFRLVRM